ncbi:DUF2799 domain-containing protein [Vibrio cionasavignyae]|uniref:DUF2799 domain-containing protein n=1 Tax=Vibrio cionasavignyae TaxID=2910252 RepID=UPI003D0D4418
MVLHIILRSVAILGVVTLFFGCSQTVYPLSNNAEEWVSFGYEQAKKGNLKQAKSDLKEYGEPQYIHYSEGYEQGRNEYCQQDAFRLGRSRQPYKGICDELDWRFRLDFNDGRANRSFGQF